MGRPAAMADPQSFDRLAVDYDRYASLEPLLVLDWLLAQLPSHGRRALDAGCGSGRHTLALADRFDEVVGVDLSQPLIDIARHQRPHPRIRYQVGDLIAMTDPHGFDLVLSSTTLHHLPDLDAALHHLRRLVASGGTVILVDNVASRPTPPGWVYRLGAVREFPADLRRHGWQQAWWLLKFRTSTAWLDHLTSDRYLSRQAFEQRYSAAFPGARFHALGYAGRSRSRHRIRTAAPPRRPADAKQPVDLRGGLLVGVIQGMQPGRVHRGGPGVAVEAELGDPLVGPAGDDRLAGRVADRW